MSEGKFLYKSASTGKFEEGKISLQDYETAAKMGVTCAQVINAKYADADRQLGTAWEQGKISAGVYVDPKPEFGIQSTTVRDAMNGDCMSQGGLFSLAGNSISAPSVPKDGSGTPASRLFLPEVILEMINETLLEKYDTELAGFQKFFIAETMSIAGSVYVQPVIDTSAPREHDSRPIAQNALPRNLVSISASLKARTVANQSIGLQISQNALEYSSLALVSLIMSQQMEGEKYRTLWSELSQVIAGNPDADQTALTPVGFKSTYDSTAAAKSLTQRGLLKLLFDETHRFNYDCLITDTDGIFALQDRDGRPLVYDPSTSGVNVGNAGTYGVNVDIANPINYSIGKVKNVMIVPSSVMGGSNRLLFMDSRYGLRKVVNSLASYSAQQEMVLQRVSTYRVDWGYLIHRLRDDEQGFRLVDYTNS